MYAVFIKEEPSSPFPYLYLFPPFPYLYYFFPFSIPYIFSPLSIPILFFQPQGTILKGYGSVFSISIPIPILSQTPPPIYFFLEACRYTSIP